MSLLRPGWLVPALALGVVVALGPGCGASSEADAGVDAGPPDAGPPDAGPPDAGPPVPDAGPVDAGPPPPPPRTVNGSVTVNGAVMQLWVGYGTRGATSHVLRLGTDDTVLPNLQLSLLFSGDATPGFTAPCGPTVFLSAQWVADGGIAYYTLDPTCTLTVTQVAQDAGQDYQGTFSGSLAWEPRSRLDAGFPVMNLTAGTFQLTRTF